MKVRKECWLDMPSKGVPGIMMEFDIVKKDSPDTRKSYPDSWFIRYGTGETVKLKGDGFYTLSAHGYAANRDKILETFASATCTIPLYKEKFDSLNKDQRKEWFEEVFKAQLERIRLRSIKRADDIKSELWGLEHALRTLF